MRRAPVLHAFVLLGTTCQLTTGPRLTMPVSGGMPGGPASTVIIQDFSFSPATVSVQVGSTVEWTNKGPSPHTARSDIGIWDSGTLGAPTGGGAYGGGSAGGSYQLRLNTPGTFHYHCSIHPPSRFPNFRGTITVTQ